jgi:hypothetical protein
MSPCVRVRAKPPDGISTFLKPWTFLAAPMAQIGRLIQM